MCWYGECSCPRRWKQPFILGRITGQPGGLQEHELRGDWQFVQYHLEVDIGTFWRNCECETAWKVISLMDEIGIVSWSSNQVGKSKSACPLRFRSMCGTDEWKQRSNSKMERSSGRTQDVSFLTKNIVGIDREAIEFEWDIFPGFSSLKILQEIQQDLCRVHGPDHLHVNVQRHRLDKKEEIVRFASRMQKKSGITRRDSCKDTGRFWVLDRKRSGMKDLLTLPKDNGTRQPMRWYSGSKKQGTLYLKSTSALSRGILKRKKGFETIHFNGDSWNTEPLFRTIHSVNQLSLCGAVASWCEQFGFTEEEKGRDNLSVKKSMLTSVPPHEVQLLVSLPTRASGNSLQENTLNFEAASNRIQFSKLCEDAWFNHRVSAGTYYTTRLDEDDGWRSIVPLCRECTFSRAHVESRVFAAIPGKKQLLDRYLEVPIVRILGQLGLEISIPSTLKHETTSYFVITRGSERFVDEIHDHKNELRPSTELLTAFQNQKGENLVWKKRNPTASGNLCSTYYKSTWQQGSLCKQSQQSSQWFFVQKDYHSYERKTVDCCWRQSFARTSFVDTSIQDGHKDGTSPRSRRTRTRWIPSLGRREIGIAEGVGLIWRTKILSRQLDSSKEKMWVLCGTQEFLLLPQSNSRTLWWYFECARTDGIHVHSLQLERVYLSQRLFVECSIYLGEWIDSGWIGKRQSPTSSLLHTAEPFWWRSRWRKNTMMITRFLRKCIITVIGNVIRMPSIEQNYREHKIKDCNSGKRSHLRSSPIILCQEIAFIEWFLRKEIEYCSKDSEPQGQLPKLRWKAIGMCSSSSLFAMKS